MNALSSTYFEQEDILHFSLTTEPEAGSVEIGPEVTAELNARGEMIGIKILNASVFIRDAVLDSVQARVLQVAEKQLA